MKFSVRQLVEISVLIALAFVLDFVAKIYSGWFWAYGGSISLSLVPLAVLAYRQGWKMGTLSGLLLGTIQLIMGSTLIHPIQVLFDYLLPYAAFCGLTGIWASQLNAESVVKNVGYNIWISTMVGSIGRAVLHILSGYIFFGSYAPEGMHPLIYSVGYNMPYLLLSWIVSAWVLTTLYRRYQTIVMD